MFGYHLPVVGVLGGIFYKKIVVPIGYVGQSKIKDTKKIDVSNLTSHLSYNYHTVASN